MRYETKTFGDLQVGQTFWSFGEDCGDPELEKVKTKPGEAKYADGEPGNIYFYPTAKEVWVPVYDNWPTYLTWICMTILILLEVAFGWYIVNYFKGL